MPTKDIVIRDRLAKLNLKVGDRVKVVRNGEKEPVVGIVVGCKANAIYPLTYIPQPDTLPPFPKEVMDIGTGYEDRYTKDNAVYELDVLSTISSPKDTLIEERLAKEGLKLGEKVKRGNGCKEMKDWEGIVIGYGNGPIVSYQSDTKLNATQIAPYLSSKGYLDRNVASEYAYPGSKVDHFSCVNQRKHLLTQKDIAFNEELGKKGFQLGDKVKVKHSITGEGYKKLSDYVGTIVGLVNDHPLLSFEEDIEELTTYSKSALLLGSQYQHLAETSKKHCIELYFHEMTKFNPEAEAIKANDARLVAKLASYGWTLGERVRTSCPGIGTIIGWDTNVHSPLVAYTEDKTDAISQSIKKAKEGFASQYLSFFEEQGKHVRAASAYHLSDEEKNDLRLEAELAKVGFKLGDKVRCNSSYDTKIAPLVGTVVGISNGLLYVQYEEDLSDRIGSSKRLEGYASAYKHHHADCRKHTFATVAGEFTKMTLEHINTTMEKLNWEIGLDLARLGYSLGEKVKFDNGRDKSDATIIGIRADKKTPILLMEKDVSCYNPYPKEIEERVASQYVAAAQKDSKRMVASHPQFFTTEADTAILEGLSKLGFSPGERVLAQTNGKLLTGTVIGLQGGKFPSILLDEATNELLPHASQILSGHQQSAKTKQVASFTPSLVFGQVKKDKLIEAQLAFRNLKLGDRRYDNSNRAGEVIGITDDNQVLFHLDILENGTKQDTSYQRHIHSAYAHVRESTNITIQGSTNLHTQAPDHAIITALAKLYLKPGSRVSVVNDAKIYLATVIGFDANLLQPILEFDDVSDLPLPHIPKDKVGIAQPYRLAISSRTSAYPNDLIRALTPVEEIVCTDRIINETLNKLNFTLGQKVVLSKGAIEPSWRQWNDKATEFLYGTIVGFQREGGKVHPIILSDKDDEGLWTYSKGLGKQHLLHSSYREAAEKHTRCIYVDVAAIQDAGAFDKKRAMDAIAKAAEEVQAAELLAKSMIKETIKAPAPSVSSIEQDKEISSQLAAFKLRLGDKVELGVNSAGGIEFTVWNPATKDRIIGTVIGVLDKKPVIRLDETHSQAERGWTVKGTLGERAKFSSKEPAQGEQRFLFIEQESFHLLPLFEVKLGQQLHHPLYGKGTIIGATNARSPIIAWDYVAYNSASKAGNDYLPKEYAHHTHFYILSKSQVDQCKTLAKEQEQKMEAEKTAINKAAEEATALLKKDQEIEKQLSQLKVKLGDQVEVSLTKGGYVEFSKWEEDTKTITGTVIGTLKDNGETPLLIELPENNPTNSHGWSEAEYLFERANRHSKYQAVKNRLLYVKKAAFRPIPKWDVRIGDRLQQHHELGVGTVIGTSITKIPLIAWERESSNNAVVYSDDYIAPEYSHLKRISVPDEVFIRACTHLAKVAPPAAPILADPVPVSPSEEKTKAKSSIPDVIIGTATIASLALPNDRSSFRHHFHEAGYRIAAHQLTNLSKAGLVKLLRSKGMDNLHIQNFTDFLETELGKSIFSLILGMGLSQIKQEDQRLQKLGAEFRIGGMTSAGNLAIDTLIEYLKPALLEMIDQKKPEEKVRVSEYASPLAETLLEEAAIEEEEERQFKH